MNMTKFCEQLTKACPALRPKLVLSRDIEVEDHMIELPGCGTEFHVSGGPFGASVVHETKDGFTFVDVRTAKDVVEQLLKWNALPHGKVH